MKLSENTISLIKQEYSSWQRLMYAGKNKEERQKMGQFFTPPELSIKLVEKFDKLDGNCLDPTCGAGNLLIAMFFAKFQYYNPDYKGKWCNKPFQDCLDEIYGIELDPEILKVCHKRIQHLCDFIRKKYKFTITFDPKHFQLGDALTDDPTKDEFWDKDSFIRFQK